MEPWFRVECLGERGLWVKLGPRLNSGGEVLQRFHARERQLAAADYKRFSKKQTKRSPALWDAMLNTRDYLDKLEDVVLEQAQIVLDRRGSISCRGFRSIVRQIHRAMIRDLVGQQN